MEQQVWSVPCARQSTLRPRVADPLKAGQLEYDCRDSKMHGMPVTGGRGFSPNYS